MLRALVVLFALIVPAAAIAGEPIFDAAAKGDTAAIESLLANGTVVDARDRDQATPLIAAALGGQVEAAKLLLAKGADVMARNSGGFTALHAAAFSGSAAVASLLLDNKADRDDKANKAGASPFFVAAEMNHPEVVELMIAKGADVGQRESHGYMATTRAFYKGHFDMIRLLKRHGAVCQEGKLSDSQYKRCLELKD
jgi:ankyrin repeat protein